MENTKRKVLVQAILSEGMMTHRSLDINDRDRNKILQLLKSIPFIGAYTRGKETSIGYITTDSKTPGVLLLRGNQPDIVKYKRVELVIIEGNEKVYLYN